jgi:hypothetical protein
MPSYHVRKRDNEIIACTDSEGHIVENCRMHGSSDIHAENLEEAYEIMNQQENYGLRQKNLTPYESIQDIAVKDDWQGIPGSAVMVSGLLRNHQGL